MRLALAAVLFLVSPATSFSAPHKVEFIRYDVSSLSTPIMINRMIELEPHIKEVGFPLRKEVLPDILSAPSMIAMFARISNILDHWQPVFVHWHRDQSAMEVDALELPGPVPRYNLSHSFMTSRHLERDQRWVRMAREFSRMNLNQILNLFDNTTPRI